MVVILPFASSLSTLGGLLFKASAATKVAAASAGVATGVATGVASGVAKLSLITAGAIKIATAIIGVGKLAILPFLIAAIAYYNYDLMDPENRPFNILKVEKFYDFVIVGGGSAGTVLASRLSEVKQWKILLLEAGGHENEISDVPLLSLYLHTSKLDWKYR